jgi:protein-L-isoaspartate(D-aspartate) O-methyltransferase
VLSLAKEDTQIIRRRALINILNAERLVRSQAVYQAMLTVPREKFLPANSEDQAYTDSPLPIGYGQTISAPHMVAIMCEALELREGHRVLEIGSGSGYHAAVVAEIIAPKGSQNPGHLFTVEIVKELARFAEENLEKLGYSESVTLICADGSQGYPNFAPYDRIYVTAAAPEVPQPLVDQLVNGGILLVPVGHRHFFQTLLRVEKDRMGKTSKQDLGGVAFVPLTGKYGWNE